MQEENGRHILRPSGQGIARSSREPRDHNPYLANSDKPDVAKASTGFGEYFVLSKGSRFFMLIYLLNGLYHSAFWVTFFLYLSFLGYEKYLIGILSGIGLYASFATLFFSGYIADRFGRKPTLVAGAFVSLVSICCFLMVPHPLLLGLASGLTGVSNALLTPSLNGLLSDKEPESRR